MSNLSLLLIVAIIAVFAVGYFGTRPKQDSKIILLRKILTNFTCCLT